MRTFIKCDTRTLRPRFFHVTFRKREHLWLVSLHCVCTGQLPDWGESLRWRQAFWLWHSVQSCHLLLDSTSAVPPCFPGLVPSTRLLACFSPWALRPAHPAQHPHVIRLAGAFPPLPISFTKRWVDTIWVHSGVKPTYTLINTLSGGIYITLTSCWISCTLWH